MYPGTALGDVDPIENNVHPSPCHDQDCVIVVEETNIK